MKALIQSVTISMDRPQEVHNEVGQLVAQCYSGGATVDLRLRIFAEEDLGELWSRLRPGNVLSDFGVADLKAPPPKETKLLVPGRKLCLD